MKTKLFKRKLVFLLPLLLIILMYACRKELSDVTSADEETAFDVNAAKAYHNANFKNSMNKGANSTSSSEDINKSFSGGTRMGWRLATSFKKGNLQMVEVPISFKRTRMRAYSFGGTANPQISDVTMLRAAFHRYVIYKGKSGKVNRRFLTFMPDKDYIAKYGTDASKNGANRLEKHFSGYVEYNDGNYNPLFVYRIKGGKAVQKVLLKKRTSKGKSTKSKGNTIQSDCEHCEPEYELECEVIDDPDATGGWGGGCTEIFTGFACYEIPCPGGDEDPYPDDDCNNPNNYDLPECSFDEEDCEYYGTCDDGGGNPCGYSVNSKGIKVMNDCGGQTNQQILNNLLNSDADYREAYYRMNPAEKSLSLQHPFASYEVYKNSNQARNVAATIYPNLTTFPDNKVDALRHAVWNGLNAHDIGSFLATGFGDAHEENPINNTLDQLRKDMDLLNNAIGRQATIDLMNQGNYSEQNLIDVLILKANTGGLWVIVNGVLVGS